MKTGITLIKEERQRQIKQEGWSAEHDDCHIYSELAEAAVCYAAPSGKIFYRPISRGAPQSWPWSKCYWRPTPQDRIRELVKAGALLAAEIDRLNRKSHRKTKP